MGRRDEPELDELSRLLRRLETMEVSPKAASTREAEPEAAKPQAEYVGALRGAAPAKAAHDQHKSPHKSTSYRALDAGASTGNVPRSASTTAIVIGAATAAVVSSVVAAGLVLWSSGAGQNGQADRRMTFYSPAEPVAAPRRSGPDRPADPPSSTNAEALLQRADVYLRGGKPGEARIVLEQAARLGSGVAALTLGAMYDPGRTTQFSNLEIKADPTVARAWYERAKDLGVAEANDRLAQLAAR